jgi:hypothetical protein
LNHEANDHEVSRCLHASSTMSPCHHVTMSPCVRPCDYLSGLTLACYHVRRTLPCYHVTTCQTSSASTRCPRDWRTFVICIEQLIFAICIQQLILVISIWFLAFCPRQLHGGVHQRKQGSQPLSTPPSWYHRVRPRGPLPLLCQPY